MHADIPPPPGTRHPLEQTPPSDQAPLQSRHLQDQAPPDQAPPISHPGTRHPPPRSRHSTAQCMLGDTVNERAVCILLECNLVFSLNLAVLHAHINNQPHMCGTLFLAYQAKNAGPAK